MYRVEFRKETMSTAGPGHSHVSVADAARAALLSDPLVAAERAETLAEEASELVVPTRISSPTEFSRTASSLQPPFGRRRARPKTSGPPPPKLSSHLRSRSPRGGTVNLGRTDLCLCLVELTCRSETCVRRPSRTCDLKYETRSKRSVAKYGVYTPNTTEQGILLVARPDRVRSSDYYQSTL